MATTAHSEVPAAGENLAAEILKRRRKRLPAVTAVLSLAVVAAGAFIGGIEVQKHYRSSSSGTSGAAAAALPFGRAGAFTGAGGRGGFGQGGATGGGGFGNFGGGAGGATIGTVTLIKGSTLYITEASGNTILVHTAPTSRVTKTVGGTMQTIHPGDNVAVTGTQAANGSVTAASIAITGGTNNG
jgi:hypothetical protein